MAGCYRQIHACRQPRRGSSDNLHQTTTEMARAHAVQSTGETPAGGNSSLPCHNTCQVELPCPLHTWPGMLTSPASGTGSGAIHIHHHHHHLQPLQALYVSYPLVHPHPEGQGGPHANQQLPAVSQSSSSRRCRGAQAPSVVSGEEPALHRQEHQQAPGRRQPQPNMLPRNERPSWASPHLRVPRLDAVQEQEIMRVANQLRIIGDEINATVLHRAYFGPHWQDLRDICRGLLSFITQTLSTLYRLT